MPNTYVILIETTDKDGVIESEFLIKNKKTYMTNSLADAIEAVEQASKWVKGKYLICALKELPSVTETN